MKIVNGREDWLLLVLAAGCVVLAYAFVRVGAEVLEGDLFHIDQAVRNSVQASRTSFGNAFFGAISMLGSKPILVVASMVMGWFLFRRVEFVMLILLCALISSEFVDYLKGQFEVLRPPTGLALRKSTSFPSGHVSGTTAVATLLGYASFRQRRLAWLLVPGGAVLVVLMAMSRVYLDMHWTSDVLGGALIGMMLGASCCLVFEWMRRRYAAPRGRVPVSQPAVDRSP